MSAAHPSTVPPASVAALVGTHAALVYRNLHRLGVNPADAPDLLQETFLVVHRRWREYDPAQPIEGWLWGIALGLVRNHRRKVLHRNESHRSMGDHGWGQVGLGAPTAATPEDELTRTRQRRDIQAAIDALEPEKRAVFVMFELEGLSGQDIALALGIALGTVHSRLFTARKELTSALAVHAHKEASR